MYYSWEYVASMNEKRASFILIAYSGKLWAIGGARNKDVSVEIYDPGANSWSYGPPMNSNHTYQTGSFLSLDLN